MCLVFLLHCTHSILHSCTMAEPDVCQGRSVTMAKAATQLVVHWTLDLLVVSSKEEGTGHAQSLSHRTPSPRFPQRRARSPSSMEYRLGGHMKAVGPRQTACRLLPVQVPANMVTDDNAHYQVAISRSRLLGRVRMPCRLHQPRRVPH